MEDDLQRIVKIKAQPGTLTLSQLSQLTEVLLWPSARLSSRRVSVVSKGSVGERGGGQPNLPSFYLPPFLYLSLSLASPPPHIISPLSISSFPSPPSPLSPPPFSLPPTHLHQTFSLFPLPHPSLLPLPLALTTILALASHEYFPTPSPPPPLPLPHHISITR